MSLYTVYLVRAGQDEYVNDIEAESPADAVSMVVKAFPELENEDLYAVIADSPFSLLHAHYFNVS
jgi:hypothetical protein